jgi:hypothetical protein
MTDFILPEVKLYLWGHSMLNRTVLTTMSLPIFIIFILQVDIHMK